MAPTKSLQRLRKFVARDEYHAALAQSRFPGHVRVAPLVGSSHTGYSPPKVIRPSPMPTATTATPPDADNTVASYRPEIDGLRALAILLVVLFHAFPHLLPGGFVGVDVFFVISGYLITRMVWANCSPNEGCLVKFYAGRIRRLFPALAVVLASTLMAGWFVMFPDEYAHLGQHVVSSALFFTNFELSRGSSYFAPEASSNPLLHLWSLAIEEQFYLCWPALLTIARRRSLSPKIFSTFLLASSFLYGSAIAGSDAIALFYSPLTRSWELLLGGILALQDSTAKTNRIANIAAGTGLMLIGIAAFMLSKATIFPGAWGLMPTTGAALLVWAGPRSWINSSLFSYRHVVGLGLISYPLYLWHWVLLSYSRILYGSNTSFHALLLLILSSCLLAWLTYRFIELPFRFGRLKPRAPGILVLSLGICALAGYFIFQSHGIPERRSKREREILDFFENSSPRFQYLFRENIFRKWQTECSFFDFGPDLAGQTVKNRRDTKPIARIAEHCYTRDEKYKNSVLLWGDSHAKALSPGLRKYLPHDWQLLQVSTLECPLDIAQTSPSTTNQCDQSNYFAIKTVRDAKPDVVVVAQNEDHSPDAFQRIATYLKELGVKRVVLVGPAPHWAGDLPHLLARSRLYMPRRTREHLLLKHGEVNESLKRALPQDSSQKYANLMSLLCDEDGCLTYLGDDVKTTITSWDYGHLTPFTSEFVARELLVDLITSPE